MTGPAATIFALSSGAPPAAIAIVRISGPAAGQALAVLAGRLPSPRHATRVRLRDLDDATLDQALALWFPGPASATGEDCVELHLHGGRAVVARVLAVLAAEPGLRAAEAGEFTRRAFLNGRIDLLEAEGLADLLAAETEAERRRALHAAEGGLSRLVEQWHETLLTLSARAEALIEYGDGEEDVGADPMLAEDVATLAAAIDAVLARPPAERLRDGLRVVIAGPPNSGKSTLFNAIVARDAAIVSSQAGTTRDLLEAPLRLGEHALILVDSAGLRDSDDAIEREGIARAEAAIARADLMLWLGDCETPPPHPNCIVVRSKADVHGSSGAGLPVSARTGTGIPKLIAALQHELSALSPVGDASVFLEHQRALLGECRRWLCVGATVEPLLLAEHLRKARETLDCLTGRAGTEAMLDRLFGRFCIGK